MDYKYSWIIGLILYYKNTQASPRLLIIILKKLRKRTINPENLLVYDLHITLKRYL
jgi:hypothetical protein